MATAPFNEESLPDPESLFAATSLSISGGIFNNSERGTNHFTFNKCQIFMTEDGRVVRQGSAVSSTASNSRNVAVVRRNKTQLVQEASAQCRGSPSHQLLHSPDSLAQFPRAKDKLDFIITAVESNTNQADILGRILPHLRALGELVNFTFKAYNACNDKMSLGRTIRSVINSRMEQCNTVLKELHREILQLQPRNWYAARVTREWWTGKEPEELTTLRGRIMREVREVGEWLRALHSFWWASSQLLLTTSEFSLGSLEAFLKSGPISLLPDVHIEHVIFLEPLQGKACGMPLHFVASFEDVHMAIALACQGTAASRFIGTRSYELNEATTNITAEAGNILRQFQKCKKWEVTIVLSGVDVKANICPRCSILQSAPSQGLHDWSLCTNCGTKFKSLLPSSAANETPRFLDERREKTAPREDLGSRMSDTEAARLFRRLKFEVTPNLEDLSTPRPVPRPVPRPIKASGPFTCPAGAKKRRSRPSDQSSMMLPTGACAQALWQAKDDRRAVRRPTVHVSLRRNRKEWTKGALSKGPSRSRKKSLWLTNSMRTIIINIMKIANARSITHVITTVILSLLVVTFFEM